MPLRVPGLAVILVGAFLVAGAGLGLVHAWPFEEHATKDDPNIWSGDVTLLVGQDYSLSSRPVVVAGQVVAGQCASQCLMVTRGGGGKPSLQAVNGVLAWPRDRRPTYADCVSLRNTGTLDAVVLGSHARDLGHVPLYGWMCATGGNVNGKSSAGLLRLRYLGAVKGSEGYRFAVTAWPRPPEG